MNVSNFIVGPYVPSYGAHPFQNVDGTSNVSGVALQAHYYAGFVFTTRGRPQDINFSRAFFLPRGRAGFRLKYGPPKTNPFKTGDVMRGTARQ